MLRRVAVGTAAVTGLALSLTGCLGSVGEKAGANLKLTAAEILGRTAQRADNVDTFKMSMEVDSQASSAAMNMKMTADVQLRPTTAMRIATQPMSVQGMKVPGFEVLIDANAMYLKMPMLAAQNGGKPWSKVPLSDISAASGLNLSSMMDQAKQKSPAEQTKMFTASKDVREVGTENVGGVQTRHFVGTVPVTAALGKIDPQNRAKLEQQYQKLGVSTIGFDMWVGSDNLPRKVIARMPGSSGGITTTVLYSGYGKPVNVTPPPASEVGSLKLPNMSGA